MFPTRKFKLTQDLITIAIADGRISEVERKMIQEIYPKEGISQDIVSECMLGYDEDEKVLMPVKRKDKTGYLTKLTRVMGIDFEMVLMDEQEQATRHLLQ